MKRFKFLAAAVATSICMSGLSAAAKPSVDFSLNLETGKTELLISAEPETEMVVQFWDASDTEILNDLNDKNIGSVLKYATQVKTSSEGKARLDYKLFFPSGMYRVSVSDGNGESWTKDFYYFSSEDKEELLTDIKAAWSNPDELMKLTEENASLLNIDTSLYEELKKDKDIRPVYNRLVKRNAPDTLDAFSAAFDEEVIVFAFGAAGTPQEIKYYLESCAAALKIPENINILYEEFLNEADQGELRAELADIGEFDSIGSIRNVFSEACVFYACRGSSYPEFDRIAELGEEIIGKSILEKYYSLSEVRKTEIAKEVCRNNDYSNYDEWVDGFIVLVNKKPGRPSGGSGGSSSGGGGGGVPPKKNDTPEAQIQIPKPPEQSEVPEKAAPEFEDMKDFSWAEDAVRQLAKAGIVAGRGENKFCPGEGVTREEFLAMLMRSFEIKTDGFESDFKDVSKGEWYYDAVAAAQGLGLTEGVGDGNFGVGIRITRQEMCVLAYRFALLSKVEFKENSDMPFEDGVAQYAYDAVAALYGAGIVSGMGGNEFMPESGANRAQAAKIIYSLLLYAERI